MVHEAAHALNWQQDVIDVSRRGQYHNRRFAEMATVVGLDWPADTPPSASHGFRDVVLSQRARDYAGTAALLAELDEAITEALPALAPVYRSTRTDTRQLAECECGRKIRVGAAVLDLGPIICSICQQPFTPR
ncbi:hypothetical protein [Streptomyces sp. CB03911]|uniref:hypothetical protein n=1 Tax=Streptomyces sp. CB03911 TaxID=1804758 RepID=UPI000966F4CB|nr:hypothetical protein [Streptomyces sp. CB03911]OKI19301.1 hypothetical protein A6A07_07305 [Streptomyces sp. CB03911]